MYISGITWISRKRIIVRPLFVRICHYIERLKPNALIDSKKFHQMIPCRVVHVLWRLIFFNGLNDSAAQLKSVKIKLLALFILVVVDQRIKVVCCHVDMTWDSIQGVMQFYALLEALDKLAPLLNGPHFIHIPHLPHTHCTPTTHIQNQPRNCTHSHQPHTHSKPFKKKPDTHTAPCSKIPTHLKWLRHEIPSGGFSELVSLAPRPSPGDLISSWLEITSRIICVFCDMFYLR